jgi:hypothetical protein
MVMAHKAPAHMQTCTKRDRKSFLMHAPRGVLCTMTTCDGDIPQTAGRSARDPASHASSLTSCEAAKKQMRSPCAASSPHRCPKWARNEAPELRSPLMMAPSATTQVSLVRIRAMASTSTHSTTLKATHTGYPHDRGAQNTLGFTYDTHAVRKCAASLRQTTTRDVRARKSAWRGRGPSSARSPSLPNSPTASTRPATTKCGSDRERVCARAHTRHARQITSALIFHFARLATTKFTTSSLRTPRRFSFINFTTRESTKSSRICSAHGPTSQPHERCKRWRPRAVSRTRRLGLRCLTLMGAGFLGRYRSGGGTCMTASTAPSSVRANAAARRSSAPLAYSSCRAPPARGCGPGHRSQQTCRWDGPSWTQATCAAPAVRACVGADGRPRRLLRAHRKDAARQRVQHAASHRRLCKPGSLPHGLPQQRATRAARTDKRSSAQISSMVRVPSASSPALSGHGVRSTAGLTYPSARRHCPRADGRD